MNIYSKIIQFGYNNHENFEIELNLVEIGGKLCKYDCGNRDFKLSRLIQLDGWPV